VKCESEKWVKHLVVRNMVLEEELGLLKKTKL
jgi:hypothetical protein